MLTAAGVLNADKFTDERLIQKLRLYNELPPSQRKLVTEERLVFTQKKLLTAIKLKEEILLVDSAAETTKPAPVKVPPAPKPPRKGKPGKPVEPKKDVPRRGVGIKSYVIGILENASDKKPVRKNQVAAKVVRQFPDRDPRVLKNTVEYYIPGYLRKCGVAVKSSTEGYWIEKET